jgi:hypothetical protein
LARLFNSAIGATRMTTPNSELRAEGGYTPSNWKAFNMVHAERGDAMTPEEIGEYVANNVRKSLEFGGSAERFLFVSEGGEDSPDICHVGNGPRGPQHAALIAAAPDLLEALRPFAAFFGSHTERDLAVPGDTVLWSRKDTGAVITADMGRIACAAIAKATGAA